MCWTCCAITVRYFADSSGVALVGEPEDLDGAEDRRQRIAQLVREHRQELVLAAVGLLQLPQRALALVDVDQRADPFADRAVGVADRDGGALANAKGPAGRVPHPARGLFEIAARAAPRR